VNGSAHANPDSRRRRVELLHPLCQAVVRPARDAGTLAGPARPRGRPAADPRDAQIARLEKEKAKLEQELAKARIVVDVQSKLQALLASDLTLLLAARLLRRVRFAKL